MEPWWRWVFVAAAVLSACSSPRIEIPADQVPEAAAPPAIPKLTTTVPTAPPRESTATSAPSTTTTTPPTTTAPPTTTTTLAPSEHRLALALTSLRVADLEDAWPGRNDEVVIAAIAVLPDGREREVVWDLGKVDRDGVATGPEPLVDVVVVPDDERLTVGVQLIAIERDSDSVGGIADELHRIFERGLNGATDGERHSRLTHATVDELRSDGGLFTNDNDVLGVCWVEASIDGQGDLRTDSESVTDCQARDRGPASDLTVDGEGGRWELTVRWITEDVTPPRERVPVPDEPEPQATLPPTSTTTTTLRRD